MIISVVMTTYNGSKYIEKQLDSVFGQTLVPDEVVVSDDCSSDETVEIIKRYISEKGLADIIKLFVNESNIGWKRNFYKAIEKASGEIIFFSDQDDIWLPDKVQKMTSIMNEKKVGCVYGGYQFINANGQRLEGAEERKSFKGFELGQRDKINSVVTMGCRMCISKEVKRFYLNINEPNFAYDTQCGRLSLLFFGFYNLKDPVILYRIHESNASRVKAAAELGSSNLEIRIADINDNIKWLYKLKKYIDQDKITEMIISKMNQKNIDETKALIENWIRFQEKRHDYLNNGKISLWVKMLPFINYYADISMYAGDFIYRHRINNLLKGL